MKFARWGDADGPDHLAFWADGNWYDIRALMTGRPGFDDRWWSAAAVSPEPVYRDLPQIAARCRTGPLPAPLPPDQVETGLRAPVWGPAMVYCAALNYHSHVAESGSATPEEPLFFLKPSRCVVPPGGDIQLPASSRQVDYEAELGVVIGRAGKAIRAAQVAHYIGGYTIVNDISFRDLQIRQGPAGRVVDWVRGKALDSSAPIGPWVVLPDQLPRPERVDIRLTVNGQPCQDGNTSDMIFGIPALIEALSADITLRPGDVIATGTCAGVGKYRGRFLGPGDQVAISVAGIGTLVHGTADRIEVPR